MDVQKPMKLNNNIFFIYILQIFMYFKKREDMRSRSNKKINVVRKTPQIFYSLTLYIQ